MPSAQVKPAPSKVSAAPPAVEPAAELEEPELLIAAELLADPEAELIAELPAEAAELAAELAAEVAGAALLSLPQAARVSAPVVTTARSSGALIHLVFTLVVLHRIGRGCTIPGRQRAFTSTRQMGKLGGHGDRTAGVW
ncbi:hypothetical protein GCM10009818_33960 [Nakamurella flavida]